MFSRQSIWPTEPFPQILIVAVIIIILLLIVYDFFDFGVWGYLLDHGQITSDYTPKKNDSPSPSSTKLFS